MIAFFDRVLDRIDVVRDDVSFRRHARRDVEAKDEAKTRTRSLLPLKHVGDAQRDDGVRDDGFEREKSEWMRARVIRQKSDAERAKSHRDDDAMRIGEGFRRKAELGGSRARGRRDGLHREVCYPGAVRSRVRRDGVYSGKERHWWKDG